MYVLEHITFSNIQNKLQKLQKKQPDTYCAYL